MHKTLLFLFTGIVFITSCQSSKEGEVPQFISVRDTLTSDGTWCWFSDPRAIYRHNGKPEIVTGWVTSDGSIEAAVLNLATKEKNIQNVSPQLEIDDHANPSFLELENKQVLMSYAKHFDMHVRINTLKPDSDAFGSVNMIYPFDEEELKKFPKAPRVTYANTYSLKEENGRIYCFGRWTGYKPNLNWSDDGGNTFNPAKVFISNFPFDDNNRPYVKYYSNGKSKIHIVFTDGHPRKEPTNSIYYAYYENGSFYKADGSKICDLEGIPFEPKQATVVYKATEETGRAWMYDMASDKEGNPVILYARYPEETKHIYHYARFTGADWLDNKICDAGKWFPQTPEDGWEREPHYSAGLTIDPLDVNTIFVSRNINGVFELEKCTTNNIGNSWEITPITKNSQFDNVRPFVPKNRQVGDPLVVLWMVNEKYIHYTDYKTRIEYYIDPK